MSFVAIAYGVLFYTATVVFIVGLSNKVVQFTRAPAPLRIPTMPAPLTRLGAAGRVAREIALFESLFRSDKWLWLFSVLFHLGLLLVLLRHARYFLSQDLGIIWGLVVLIQPFGMYAAFIMLAGLFALLGRRLILSRVRYITSPSDIILLLLFLGIGLSGVLLTFSRHTDVVALKRFFVGLSVFSLRPLPIDILLLVHLFCVAILMIVFPFSKLLHLPGVFFSPTRNQCDDSRERRYVATWATELSGSNEKIQ